MNRHEIMIVLVVLMLAALSGCIVDDLQVEGRRCGANQPCGPGAVCDPVTKVCVTAQLTDGPVKPDAPTDAKQAKDDAKQAIDMDQGPTDQKPVPDQPRPDQFLALDGGCPSGLKRCGAVCVDTSKNPYHCGGCNKKCPGATTDRCLKGVCTCGPLNIATKPGPCTGSRNCKGSMCTCVMGGLCKGCCNGKDCVSSPSITQCGKAGSACKSCSDSVSCTTDTCSSAGLCTNQLKTGYCAIGLGSTAKKCYTNGTVKFGTTCFVCDTKKSTSVWTYSSSCLSGIQVSSVVPLGSLGYVRDVLVSSSGVLVVADTGYHAIRQISGTTITTVAGTLGSSGLYNGTKTSAKFNQPYQLAADSAGNIYVADRGNHAIRKISTTGLVSIVAGNGTAGSTDGSTSSARFTYPSGVALGSDGSIYVADTNNHTIRRIYGSTVTTIGGKAGALGSTDGTCASSRFYYPHGIVFYQNKLYVADMYNNKIRVMDLTNKSYTTKTVAGSGSTAHKDGPVATAGFTRPGDVAVSSSGRIYVVDFSGQRLRMIHDGQVVTLAGTGSPGYVNGAATIAKFNAPAGISLSTVKGKGWIYIADYINRTIRLVRLTTAP